MSQGRPKSRRKKSRYPNLEPHLNLKTRWEEINDVASYVKKLPEEAKEWMNKFMGEWTNADLDYKDLKNNLHNTKELKKSCTDRNNARNRDIFSRAKASDNLKPFDELGKSQKLSSKEPDDFEDDSNETSKSSNPPEELE